MRKSLGAWLDRELGASDAAALQLHLQSCAACAAEKARLERMDASLKNVLEMEASQVAFEPFWAGVRQRIAEERPWRIRMIDWTRAFLTPPRLAWAVPAMIILLLGIFSLEKFFPGWPPVFGQTNLAAVEHIDGHGFNVALLREAKTKTTVIWLFDNQENENETSAEPASSEQAF